MLNNRRSVIFDFLIINQIYVFLTNTNWRAKLTSFLTNEQLFYIITSLFGQMYYSLLVKCKTKSILNGLTEISWCYCLSTWDYLNFLDHMTWSDVVPTQFDFIKWTFYKLKAAFSETSALQKYKNVIFCTSLWKLW
jgi:hypothetical protein